MAGPDRLLAVLLGLVLLGLALLYRFGPSRAPARWRWVTPGSLVAAVLWLAGSLAFSLYVAKFAAYNETYGALGGVIILLMWLYHQRLRHPARRRAQCRARAADQARHHDRRTGDRWAAGAPIPPTTRRRTDGTTKTRHASAQQGATLTPCAKGALCRHANYRDVRCCRHLPLITTPRPLLGVRLRRGGL